jgi:preprotein translocase subunit SecE
MPLPLITGLIVLATLAVVGVLAYLIDQIVDRD